MLKERLRQVENLVDVDSLIDIGTDHGYLIIDLLNKGIISKAMAVEITKGPLENVVTNVRNHRLSDKVEAHLSDGLTKVDKTLSDQYQGVSICGMGGALIAKILTDSKSKIADKSLFLQPNNGEQILRQKLVELGFTICQELVVVDNQIYYEIIKAVPGNTKLNELELYFGPQNLQTRSDAFIAKHTEQYKHLMQINENLMKNNKQNQKIDFELKMLEEVLDEAIKNN